MSASTGLRAALLGGIAVLGIAVALAISTHDRHGGGTTAPTAAGEWYTAMAAPSTRTKPKRGTCGIVVGPRTLGVAHPVLPCGVKLYLEFHGKEVLTQVVDNGHPVPGHVFDVMPPVAKRLGLEGSQMVRWRFAS